MKRTIMCIDYVLCLVCFLNTHHVRMKKERMHKMVHINVGAAICGIWQPLKKRGHFLLNKARGAHGDFAHCGLIYYSNLDTKLIVATP